MKEKQFWCNASKCIPGIFNTTDSLMQNMYVFVVDMKSHWTWCSKSLCEHFEIPDAYVEDIQATLAKFVHLDSRQKYACDMERRLRGLDLEQEFFVLMKGIQRDFDLFSFYTERYTDTALGADYVVFVIKNESILPQFDALTDLYSKMKYLNDLKRIIQTEQDCIALLQISLEGFASMNIIYGTIFANRLLREVSVAFIQMMDADSAVYRLDGEKFVFILKKSSREALLAFYEWVRKVLAEQIEVDGKNISLKISAGAILLEHYSGDALAAQNQVAYAHSHSANVHHGELVIFNDEVQLPQHVNLDLMKVIHQSVRENCRGFYVEYQPVVNSENSRIVGAEALVRWSMEPYGKVPPGMFIEWMEEDPGMYELGNFVLRTALEDTRPLLEICPSFFLNVNISARQLERHEFRDAVLKMLQETGFPANHLCMELTERCRNFPIETIASEVAFFQSYGIRFAMDDYGTGSASSDIVMKVPMDEIKLDMSFIRGIQENPKNQAMVESIVEFANKSGMTTCLEGVETKDLQDYLRSYGATWFQGYYYSKPVGIGEVERLLSEQAKAD